MDNRVKIDKNNIDFMPFIQIDIDGHIEFEQSNECDSVIKPLKIQCFDVLQEQKTLE